MNESRSGTGDFSDLCQTLIDEEGYHWLYPEISRTRSSDWVACIYSHSDKDRKELLATGQADTLESACAAAVEDYHERARIRARKDELMKDPKVQEAFKLFNVQTTLLLLLAVLQV